MAKLTTLIYIIGAVILILLLFHGQIQAMLGNGYATMNECQSALNAKKVSYPNGYFTICKLVDTPTANCIQWCELDTSGMLNKYNFEYGMYGLSAMNIYEKCRADCIDGTSLSPCVDSDGIDYQFQGLVTGKSGVKYVDYCQSTKNVVDYTCNPANGQGIGNTYDCSLLGAGVTCANGACGNGNCNTGADLTPCDGKVNLTELAAYTTRWKQGTVTLTLLAAATSAWKAG
jgi:hypothetical protein